MESNTGKNENASPTPRAGLCSECRFMRLIRSDRGSTFVMCELSANDKAFAKYPRLPVLKCAGYERVRSNEYRADEDRPDDDRVRDSSK
jgi:hypothetical protein